MALQGRFIRFYSVFNNIRNAPSTTQSLNNWYIYPCIQQIAGLRQSIEEKLKLPEKPKRPLTPYFKFMSKIRPEVKKQHPNLSMIDLIREISHRWENVDAKTKEQLEAEYKVEQEAYGKVRLEYDTKLTPAQKELIKEEKHKQNAVKEKRKLKQKCRENNKPRRPCSGFVLFMKTELPNRGTRDFRTFQRDVAAGWSKLTDTQKKPFVEESTVLMKQYQKEMVEWERKMIKLGNTDIVRQDALIDPKVVKSRTRATHKKDE